MTEFGVALLLSLAEKKFHLKQFSFRFIFRTEDENELDWKND